MARGLEVKGGMNKQDLLRLLGEGSIMIAATTPYQEYVALLRAAVGISGPGEEEEEIKQTRKRARIEKKNKS
jgi:hypothetical protein